MFEKKDNEQIPENYREFKIKFSLGFVVIFYDDKIIIPKSLRQTMIMLLQKEQYTLFNSIQLTIRTDKGTAFICSTVSIR